MIFDIKKYAIHDGPGIRTTVFFKGCPLKCWWCHNPEGLTLSAQGVYRKDRCVGCDECINACPEGAIALSPLGVITDLSKCIRCGTCAEICPAEARELIGKEMSVDEVIEEIEKWLHSVDLPTNLKEIGIKYNQIQSIEEYALEDPCCPLNPKKVEKGDVVEIIDKLL